MKRQILENVFSKEEAHKVCAQFLGELWGNTSLDDFSYEVFSGGMSNRLYVCAIPGKDEAEGQVPKKVLLRIYGSQYIDIEMPYRTGCEASEAVIFHALSQENLGPKMFGVFPGGRIEEFVPSHRITNEELMDPKMNGIVAKILAHFHSLQMPVKKQPMKIVQIIKLFGGGFSPPALEQIPKEYQMYAKAMLDFDMDSALTWVQSNLPKIKTRIVFSHNDTNKSNVLVKHGTEGQAVRTEDQIVLVDYEYASYNYRGMDIGSYLFQRRFNYSNPAHPISGLSHPSEEERRFFIREYLKESKRIGKVEMDPDIDSEDNLLMEADFFILAVNLLGLSFAHTMMGKPGVEGFYEYGHLMVSFFNENKEKFAKRYSDQLA